MSDHDTNSQRKRSWIFPIAVLTTGLLAIPCLGAVVAIGLPMWLGLEKEAKVAEAEPNLQLLRSALEAYRAEHGRYPPDLPAMPGEPGPEPRRWPTGDQRGWDAIAFRPSEHLYFAYEVETSDDGASYTARARGDLDGDGQQSRFELRSGIADMLIIDSLE
jgi:type II secretory pathway pseudopilin PulG